MISDYAVYAPCLDIPDDRADAIESRSIHGANGLDRTRTGTCGARHGTLGAAAAVVALKILLRGAD
jgi:hypothetical protein